MKYIILLILLIILLYFFFNIKEQFLEGAPSPDNMKQNYTCCNNNGNCDIEYNPDKEITVTNQQCMCYNKNGEEVLYDSTKHNFDAFKIKKNCNHYCYNEDNTKIEFNNNGQSNSGEKCKCSDANGNMVDFDLSKGHDINSLKENESCNFYCDIYDDIADASTYKRILYNSAIHTGIGAKESGMCFDDQNNPIDYSYLNEGSASAKEGSPAPLLGLNPQVNNQQQWQKQKSKPETEQQKEITKQTYVPDEYKSDKVSREPIYVSSSIINYAGKILKLENITKMSSEILDETETKCTIDSECNNGKCISLDNRSGKCYSVLKTDTYELDRNNFSYIELINVDSLNISFGFIILLKDGENQLIVKSQLNTWSLHIKDGKFTLTINGVDAEINKDKSILEDADLNKLYNVIIKVTTTEITCSLNDKSHTKSFYDDTQDRNIYKCKPDDKCGDGINGECVKLYESTETADNMMKCEYNKKHSIYFGGVPGSIADDKYFNGTLGGFDFDLDNILGLKCDYKYEGLGIQKDCMAECNNTKKDVCTNNQCKEQCKNIKICNFESSKNYSRHAVDCMEKCIKPENECDTAYCKEQCWRCGSDCFWIKNNNFSDNKYADTNGRPYPPKISLTTTSYDGTKANLKWEPPKEGKSSILGYISLTYKTYKQNEGIKIDKIDNYNCNKYCEYIISNLTPNETYSVAIRAYNSLGIGLLSNLITFKTQKKSVNTDILNSVKEPTGFEIGSFDTCTESQLP